MKKNILITGATSGFGYMAAEKLLAEGHTVYAGARDIAGRNKEPAAKLKELGAHPVELDVTNQSDIEGVFKSIDKLDVLVNNAGIAQMGATEGYTMEQFRQIFEVNVFGVHAMNRAALPLLRESDNALIIYTSSVLGRICMVGGAIYTASKWAVDGFAEAFSYELVPLGIDTAIVEPGAMGTDILNKMIPPKDESRLSHYGHMQSLGEEIMGAVGALFEGDGANDPMDVAQTYVDLINMPQGQRPLRTSVGKDSVLVEDLNKQSAISQDQTLDFYGLGGHRIKSKAA